MNTPPRLDNEFAAGPTIEIPREHVTVPIAGDPNGSAPIHVDRAAAIEALAQQGYRVEACWAKFGEKVTCENGHEVATVTETIWKRDGLPNTKLGFWKQPIPAGTDRVPEIKCTICERPWVRGSLGKRQLHFPDGWR